MNAYVAVTDNDWYRHLASVSDIDEVNFWQPSGGRRFRALSEGEPLLFKLHAPQNFIVGGGFFAHFSILSVSLAWEAFGEKNGASSLDEMRRRIERYRRIGSDPGEDYQIGCIILNEPFFLERADWFLPPEDFSASIQVGKLYDLRQPPLGARLSSTGSSLGIPTWRTWRRPSDSANPSPFAVASGKGPFRILVTDIYDRHCAVTAERALPVLKPRT